MKTRCKTQFEGTILKIAGKTTRQLAPGLFACSLALLLGCSGAYSLGELPEGDPLLLRVPGDGTTLVGATIPMGLTAPDVTIGFSAMSFSGAISSVGDLNGDGFDDFSAIENNPNGGAAVVRIRYGGPRPEGTTGAHDFANSGAHLLTTVVGEGLFFSNIVSAGDVNGDGYADLLISTFRCDNPLPEEGVYLLLGGEAALEGAVALSEVTTHFSPKPTMNPVASSSRSCSSASRQVISPGDLDGDGFDDFLLVEGPNRQSVEEPQGGVIRVFYGRENDFGARRLFEDADATLLSDWSIELSAIGDTNGDGRAEVLLDTQPVGAQGLGLLFLLRQQEATRLAGTLQLTDVVQQLPDAHSRTGYVQSPVIGDLDGDGLDDVLLVDDNYVAHLFYGSESLFSEDFSLTTANAIISPDTERALFVFGGDRDGDGDSELLIQFLVPRADGGFSYDNEVALLNGSSQRLSDEVRVAALAVREGIRDNRFGEDIYRFVQGVHPAGDLDGDGADELYSISAQFFPEMNGSQEVEGFQLHIHYGKLDRENAQVQLQ